MDEDHRALHHQTLNILVDKLQLVHRELQGVRDRDGAKQSDDVDPGPGSTANRIKYAFRKKRTDEAIDQLESWQGVFDISWFLTLKIASRHIDEALGDSPVSRISSTMPPTTRLRAVIRRRAPEPVMTHVLSPAGEESGIFLRGDGLAGAIITPLPFCSGSSISVAVRKQEEGQLLILDRIECTDPAVIRTVTKDVRSLALNMRDAAGSGADSFGWLRCKGVVKEVLPTTGEEMTPSPPLTTSLTMVFKVPSGYQAPMSLRAALLQGDECLGSLSDKVKLARDLAHAVSYMHIFGFVHKNIRPETVLLLHDGSVPTTAGTPLSLFLVGFERFRSEEGITYRAGDQEWVKTLYRHPRRQGLRPADTYVMQHDIYSLGACLLEIGLWESFVRYEDTGHQVSGLGTALQHSTGSAAGANSSVAVLPSNTQAFLLARAENELPKRMGTKYAEVVKTCLTCLDPANKDFGDESEFEDGDGIVVGVKYVEKVLQYKSPSYRPVSLTC